MDNDEKHLKEDFKSIHEDLMHIWERHRQRFIVFLCSYMGMAVLNAIGKCIYYYVMYRGHNAQLMFNAVLGMTCLFLLLSLALLFLLKKDEKKLGAMVTILVVYFAVRSFLSLGSIASTLTFYNNEKACYVLKSILGLFTLLGEGLLGVSLISGMIFRNKIWHGISRTVSWILIFQRSLQLFFTFICVLAGAFYWTEIFEQMYAITEVGFLSVAFPYALLHFGNTLQEEASGIGDDENPAEENETNEE